MIYSDTFSMVIYLNIIIFNFLERTQRKYRHRLNNFWIHIRTLHKYRVTLRGRHVAVRVLCLFLMVSWAGLQFAFVVCEDPTYLRFYMSDANSACSRKKCDIYLKHA